MHIETEGKKYFDMLLKTREATIRKMDDEYAREEELDKFLTSSKFVNEFCSVISKHFKGTSDWRVMRNDEFSDNTVCVISFAQEYDPIIEYSPDDMPDTSVTIIYCPEETKIETMIGNDNVFILDFMKGHQCRCKCASLYKNVNQKMYSLVIDSIQTAVSNLNL